MLAICWKYTRLQVLSDLSYITDLHFPAQLQNENVSLKTEVHVCRLGSEEVLKICEEALEDPVAKESDIQLVYRPQAEEERVYEFALTGPNNATKSSVIAAACLCPTSPPIYLRDDSCENYVDVYIGYRDTYGKYSNYQYLHRIPPELKSNCLFIISFFALPS